MNRSNSDCSCFKSNQAQPYPKLEKSNLKINLDIKELKQFIKKYSNSSKLVYLYILSTLKYKNGKIYQYGTAPNFQGGIISLCTCKHWMRTFSNIINEDDVWIAGLTGKNLINKEGDNYLYFLMKIKKKYKSHYDAWNDLKEGIRKIKCASKNKFGDLFKPKEKSVDKYDPNSYFEPVSEHPHNKFDDSGELIWYNDIKKFYKKPYVLLFGDPEYSFIWSEPMIKYSNETLTQGQRKLNFKEFSKKLQD